MPVTYNVIVEQQVVDAIEALEAGEITSLGAAEVALESNAGTASGRSITVTTESLTTAHTASQALTLTVSGVAAGDFAYAVIAGGTNTGGLPGIESVVCTADTITVTLTNYAASENAFNGTFVINVYWMPN